MHTPDYMPTPDEIREHCRQIREGWSDDVEQLRRAGTNRRVPYRVPGDNGPGVSVGTE